MIPAIFKRVLLVTSISLTAPYLFSCNVISESTKPQNGTILPLEIYENMTLTEDGSPYIVEGDLVINAGATLIIEAGVELLMADSANITVNEEIKMNGTAQKLIYIRPGPNSSRWGTLRISNASAKITHVVIEKASLSILDNDAAILGESSKITIDHLQIKNTFRCIRAYNSDVVIKNSIFQSEGEVIVLDYGTAIIESCKVEGNNQEGIEYQFVTNGIIKGNIIYSSLDDGIDINGCLDILIEDNQIYNCSDKGISIGSDGDVSYSTAIIKRNVIVNCKNGLGIKDSSYALVDHNTFYCDTIAIQLYEKISGKGGGRADVVNNIFSGSIKNVYTADELSTITISYSLSDTDTLPGVGNILGDPLFVNAENDNFHLNIGSPCIDSGDPQSPKDKDGTRTDMGAY